MSLTIVPMGVLLLLQQRGLLSSVKAVCDFGSQEFDSREPANNKVFEAILEKQGKAVPPEFYDKETGRMYGTVGDLFRALGCTYGSYDIDGRWGAVPLDLNLQHVSPEEEQKYSLAMNLGTSEHVFNQHNFFLQFHNVTQVGGLMLHLVPFHNYQNHGLYSYSPTFFFSLARYNGYESLGLWQCGKPTLNVYRSGHAKPEGKRAVLISLQRKTRAALFVMPLQVNEPMVLSAAAQEQYGAFVPEPLANFRPTGVLPDDFYLEVATGNVHEGPPSAPPAKK